MQTIGIPKAGEGIGMSIVWPQIIQVNVSFLYDLVAYYLFDHNAFQKFSEYYQMY